MPLKGTHSHSWYSFADLVGFSGRHAEPGWFLNYKPSLGKADKLRQHLPRI